MIPPKALDAWDIQPSTFEILAEGRVFRVLTRSGSRCVLKCMGKDSVNLQDRLEMETEILLHLYSSDVPVAIPIPSIGGLHTVEIDGSMYTLSPDLPRDETDPYVAKTSLEIGRSIAQLDTVLAQYDVSDFENRTWRSAPFREYRERLPVLLPYVPQQQYPSFESRAEALRQRLSRLEARSLPEQLIHRDLHYGNMLLSDGRVSGFVDCDHFSIGPRIYELAYFLGQTAQQAVAATAIERWMDSMIPLLTGYGSLINLTSEERETLYPLILQVVYSLALTAIETERVSFQLQLETIDWLHSHGDSIDLAVITLGK